MSSRGETRISAMAMAQVNYVNLRRESYMVLGMAVKAMDEEQAPEQVSSSGGHGMHACRMQLLFPNWWCTGIWGFYT